MGLRAESGMSTPIVYRGMTRMPLQDLRHRQAAPVQAVPTPFDSWSSACKGAGGGIGLSHGWYVLVAGRTGFGKTFVGLNYAVGACRHGAHTAFHSLEMGWDELAVRALAIASGLPEYRLARGPWFDAKTFEEASDVMDALPGKLWANSQSYNTLADLLTGIRQTHQNSGCRVHVIDYMQLAWVKQASSILEQITETSHAVRALTKELGIVTVGISQLNRATGSSAEQPIVQGLMGGSPLENDSDQVLLLDHSRHAKTVDDTGKNIGWKSWLLLAKNRHGPGVEIPIGFDGRTFRMRELMPDEIGEITPSDEVSIRRRSAR